MCSLWRNYNNFLLIGKIIRFPLKHWFKNNHLNITKGLIKDPNYKHYFLGVTNTRKIELHSLTTAVLTGLKVRISGRLITQRIIPKRTVQQKEIGNFKRTNNSIVDYSMFTSKNKRGAYTIKVWTTSNIDCLPKEFSAEN